MSEELTELEKMAREYFAIEEKILAKIIELPNFGEDCNCGKPNRFCALNDDFTVIVRYCLKCGGNV